MEYSKRIKKIPPYLFAEIDRAIEKKRKEGLDVISLGVGDPDLPTPENIIAALHRASQDPKNYRYPSYVGMLRFREAVAGWYKRRFNVSLNPEDEVVTLIGSKEGIGHIPLAFTNPGDINLVPSPAYPVYRIGTILADGIPKDMPLLEENGFKPDLSKISGDDAKNAKLMFINYPNAPTTATAEKEFFREVIDFARDNEIIVCHDNPYSEMAFDGYRAPSFLEFQGAKEV
ncbi:MAG: aminotransferase class I/II-fold pyridoxal phosphate-dependent enzyme, partial [Candidatus Altiarchaeales archaeon]|nr:aminotransferase class I/II-fold pyridoxal phosphate-dependent enzyme [Candidatus Altiarchaeales archaeon]